MNKELTADVFRRLSSDPLAAEIMAEHVAELTTNLKYQTTRADGATLAMQELQTEFDRLKPWAELGRLAFKAQKSICDSSYFTFYRCKDHCKNFDFCMQRDDLKGAEPDE